LVTSQCLSGWMQLVCLGYYNFRMLCLFCEYWQLRFCTRDRSTFCVTFRSSKVVRGWEQSRLLKECHGRMLLKMLKVVYLTFRRASMDWLAHLSDEKCFHSTIICRRKVRITMSNICIGLYESEWHDNNDSVRTRRTSCKLEQNYRVKLVTNICCERLFSSAD
jgi:hypothetical protein